MAVAAAHLAFGEFGKNRAPRVPAASQEAHAAPFRRWIDVITLQNDGIRLAAIDTRMFEKVLP